MGQMFYYIDHPRTPSFLIGLIKAEFDFIARHSVHPSPFLLEAGAGVEPPTKFKKKEGGLGTISILLGTLVLHLLPLLNIWLIVKM